LLEALRNQEVLDNTLVVITSDHGEQFGEHGLFDHGNGLYVQALHVPLLLRLPGRVPADVRIPASVSLRDLPATVVDLVGLGSELPGQSLAYWWTDSNGQPYAPRVVVAELERSGNAEPWYPVAKGDMTSLILDREHYIRQGDGREELYDFSVDPGEQQDLSATLVSHETLVRFRQLLVGLRRAGSASDR
jgi:arylsulfatase A-like enzyme